MPGQTVVLGPFTGGLNLASDSSNIQDSELVECINFELDLDGSLIQRPPFFKLGFSVEDTNWLSIGAADFSAGGQYVIFNYINNTTPAKNIQVFDGTTTTVVTGTGTIISRCAIQYFDRIYVIATEASPSPGGYFDSSLTWVADPTMPRGESAVFYKSRMFVVPGVNATTNRSRLTFSDPVISVALTWPSINIIDVSPGDGQNLVDVTIYNDNLVLFKEESTYVLAYDLQVTDAILRCVNTKIGAAGYRCVVTYENSLFVYNDGNVYEIVNYDFNQINTKVPFVEDGSGPPLPVFMCLLGARLIVRYFNKIYVYGLITKTWSEWAGIEGGSAGNFGPLIPMPFNSLLRTTPLYYGGCDYIVLIPDGHSSSYQEQDQSFTDPDLIVFSSIRTKDYDFNDTSHFKKLMWWGIDCLTSRNITGIASPVALVNNVTWSQLASHFWTELTLFTWLNPLGGGSVNIETDTTVSNAANRIFVKCLTTLRFRKINFQVIMQGDASPATGPARIYTLSAIVGVKQTVDKAVN